MLKSCAALLLLFSSSLAVYAQGGLLHGVVTDESGAVVPGATVNVSNGAGPVKSVTSGNDGSYSVTGLASGQYSVEATSPGLVQPQPTSVNIPSGPEAVTVNLQLRVAEEKQEVTVQENPGPMLSVDPSQNAGALILRGADLEALPDDPDDLQADLQALAGPSAGPSGGQIYIDGFTGGTIPNKDAIREVRINQNPFSPEYDKLGYGRIEILTKPGTDKLHGNLNFQNSDGFLNSRNPYAAEKSPFLQNQYGGSLSDSLGKRMSFFLDFTDRDINSGYIVNAYTFGANPDGTPIINAVTGAANGTPFNQVIVAPQNRLRISPRVDYQLSKNNTLTLRYGYTRNDIQDQGVGTFNLSTTGSHALNTDHTVQVVETAVLSPKVINETRLQLYHQENDQTADTLLPAINVQGSFNGGGAQPSIVKDTENHYELQNYTTITSGAHTWKFGIRARAVTINNYQSDSITYTFGGKCSAMDPNCLTSIELYQQALQGIGGPSEIVITSGNPQVDVHQADLGLFVGDDWRVQPNLTLSLGLRFETQTDIPDHADWAPRFGFAWAPGQSKNNPRPKTVFRGGFGIFYDRFAETNMLNIARLASQPQYTYLASALTSPLPFCQLAASGVCQTDSNGNIIFAPLTSLSPGEHTTEEIDSHLRTPYIVQSALTVERQLPKNTTVSESLVVSHGLHELRSEDINAPLPGTYTGPGTGVYPFCPNPSASGCNTGPVLLVESSGLFNQYQLITNVRSQVNSKISLNGFYMYGHAYSNTDGISTLPSNPYSMAGEYGPSALDVRDRAFIGGTITTIERIQLAPFLLINSGAPFNIVTGTDPYGTTFLNTARPYIVSGPGAGIIYYDGLYLDPVQPANCGASNQPACNILSRNYGRSPGSINFNLRIARTWGFGASRESSGNNRPRGGGGGPGGGGPRGGPGGGPRGGAGGGFGGGPGFFGGGGTATGKRYNLTLAVQARNLLNHVNPGPINGIITSPLFGESNSLASGVGAFAEPANNRRIELQARFTF